MRSKSFRTIFAEYLLVIGCVVGALATLVGGWMASRMREDALHDLEAQAIAIRELAMAAFESAPEPEFHETLRDLGDELGIRITVFADDETVIADSEADLASLPEGIVRRELDQARSRGVGRETRTSAVLQQTMVNVALHVENDGRSLGFLRASVPLRDVESRLSATDARLLFAAVVAALVGAAVALLLARRSSRLLAEMAESTEALARGELDRPAHAPMSGDVGRVFGAIQRIAARLADEEGTRALGRLRLMTVISSMVEGVIVVDRNERVVHSNEAARSILGMSDSGAQKWVWEVTDIRELIAATGSAVQQGRESRVELEILARGLFVEVNAAPIRDAESRVIGAVLVLHDMSRVRRLERVRQDFVANVSHELQTPVASIRAMTETIVDDEGMEPEIRRRFLEKILAQCQRLGALVKDLLTLARIEAVPTAVESEPIDVTSVVEEVVHSLVEVASEKSVTVAMHHFDRAIKAIGDVDGLHQVLNNLLDNAIKYTPNGGRVVVSVEEDETWVTIEVRDSGIGIRPEDQERVFERFYRVDKARSREVGGTGLGLAIVKHIVLSFGGRVSLESALDAGSTFTVQLRAP